MVNFYLVYRLSPRTNSSNIVLENCLFGKIKMTKNAGTDKYKYQGHGVGFDAAGTLQTQMERQVKLLLFLELI